MRVGGTKLSINKYNKVYFSLCTLLFLMFMANNSYKELLIEKYFVTLHKEIKLHKL